MKRNSGERGCKIAPFPAQRQLRGTEMRDKEVNVSETGTDVSLAAKVQLHENKKEGKRRGELSNFHSCSLGSSCFVGASNGMEK